MLLLLFALVAPPAVYGATEASGNPGTDDSAPARPDPVDTLVRRALDKDPTVAAAMARVRAATASAHLSGTLMDPMVSAEGMLGGMGMGSVDLMVEQPLMAPGALKAGRTMGGATENVAEAEARGVGLGLEGRIRSAAAMLAGAQARVAILEEARQVAIASGTTARAMVEAGMGATSEQAMAAMNVATIDERLAAARGEAAMARAELARAVDDVPESLPLPALPAGPPPAGDAPMVTVMEAMRGMADAERGMARAERVPGLTVSAGVSLRTANMGGSMAIAGLSSTLPIYGRQRARLDAAVATFDAASGDIEAARRQVAAEQAAMATDLATLRDRADAAARMAAAARVQADAARSAYLAGRGGMDAWNRASQAARDAEEMSVMIRAEAVATYASLAAMLGTSLVEGP